MADPTAEREALKAEANARAQLKREALQRAMDARARLEQAQQPRIPPGPMARPIPAPAQPDVPSAWNRARDAIYENLRYTRNAFTAEPDSVDETNALLPKPPAPPPQLPANSPWQVWEALKPQGNWIGSQMRRGDAGGQAVREVLGAPVDIVAALPELPRLLASEEKLDDPRFRTAYMQWDLVKAAIEPELHYVGQSWEQIPPDVRARAEAARRVLTAPAQAAGGGLGIGPGLSPTVLDDLAVALGRPKDEVVADLARTIQSVVSPIQGLTPESDAGLARLRQEIAKLPSTTSAPNIPTSYEPLAFLAVRDLLGLGGGAIGETVTRGLSHLGPGWAKSVQPNPEGVWAGLAERVRGGDAFRSDFSTLGKSMAEDAGLPPAGVALAGLTGRGLGMLAEGKVLHAGGQAMQQGSRAARTYIPLRDLNPFANREPLPPTPLPPTPLPLTPPPPPPAAEPSVPPPAGGGRYPTPVPAPGGGRYSAAPAGGGRYPLPAPPQSVSPVLPPPELVRATPPTDPYPSFNFEAETTTAPTDPFFRRVARSASPDDLSLPSPEPAAATTLPPAPPAPPPIGDVRPRMNQPRLLVDPSEEPTQFFDRTTRDWTVADAGPANEGLNPKVVFQDPHTGQKYLWKFERLVEEPQAGGFNRVVPAESTVAEVYVDQLARVFGVDNMNVRQLVLPPDHPLNPMPGQTVVGSLQPLLPRVLGMVGQSTTTRALDENVPNAGVMGRQLALSPGQKVAMQVDDLFRWMFGDPDGHQNNALWQWTPKGTSEPFRYRPIDRGRAFMDLTDRSYTEARMRKHTPIAYTAQYGATFDPPSRNPVLADWIRRAQSVPDAQLIPLLEKYLDQVIAERAANYVEGHGAGAVTFARMQLQEMYGYHQAYGQPALFQAVDVVPLLQQLATDPNARAPLVARAVARILRRKANLLNDAEAYYSDEHQTELRDQWRTHYPQTGSTFGGTPSTVDDVVPPHQRMYWHGGQQYAVGGPGPPQPTAVAAPPPLPPLPEPAPVAQTGWGPVQKFRTPLPASESPTLRMGSDDGGSAERFARYASAPNMAPPRVPDRWRTAKVDDREMYKETPAGEVVRRPPAPPPQPAARGGLTTLDQLRSMDLDQMNVHQLVNEMLLTQAEMSAMPGRAPVAYDALVAAKKAYADRDYNAMRGALRSLRRRLGEVPTPPPAPKPAAAIRIEGDTLVAPDGRRVDPHHYDEMTNPPLPKYVHTPETKDIIEAAVRNERNPHGVISRLQVLDRSPEELLNSALNEHQGSTAQPGDTRRARRAAEAVEPVVPAPAPSAPVRPTLPPGVKNIVERLVDAKLGEFNDPDILAAYEDALVGLDALGRRDILERMSTELGSQRSKTQPSEEQFSAAVQSILDDVAKKTNNDVGVLGAWEDTLNALGLVNEGAEVVRIADELKGGPPAEPAVPTPPSIPAEFTAAITRAVATVEPEARAALRQELLALADEGKWHALNKRLQKLGQEPVVTAEFQAKIDQAERDYADWHQQNPRGRDAARAPYEVIPAPPDRWAKGNRFWQVRGPNGEGLHPDAKKAYPTRAEAEAASIELQRKARAEMEPEPAKATPGDEMGNAYEPPITPKPAWFSDAMRLAPAGHGAYQTFPLRPPMGGRFYGFFDTDGNIHGPYLNRYSAMVDAQRMKVEGPPPPETPGPPAPKLDEAASRWGRAGMVRKPGDRRGAIAIPPVHELGRGALAATLQGKVPEFIDRAAAEVGRQVGRGLDRARLPRRVEPFLDRVAQEIHHRPYDELLPSEAAEVASEAVRVAYTNALPRESLATLPSGAVVHRKQAKQAAAAAAKRIPTARLDELIRGAKLSQSEAAEFGAAGKVDQPLAGTTLERVQAVRDWQQGVARKTLGQLANPRLGVTGTKRVRESLLDWGKTATIRGTRARRPWQRYLLENPLARWMNPLTDAKARLPTKQRLSWERFQHRQEVLQDRFASAVKRERDAGHDMPTAMRSVATQWAGAMDPVHLGRVWLESNLEARGIAPEKYRSAIQQIPEVELAGIGDAYLQGRASVAFDKWMERFNAAKPPRGRFPMADAVMGVRAGVARNIRLFAEELLANKGAVNTADLRLVSEVLAGEHYAMGKDGPVFNRTREAMDRANELLVNMGLEPGAFNPAVPLTKVQLGSKTVYLPEYLNLEFERLNTMARKRFADLVPPSYGGWVVNGAMQAWKAAATLLRPAYYIGQILTSPYYPMLGEGFRTSANATRRLFGGPNSRLVGELMQRGDAVGLPMYKLPPGEEVFWNKNDVPYHIDELLDTAMAGGLFEGQAALEQMASLRRILLRDDNLRAGVLGKLKATPGFMMDTLRSFANAADTNMRVSTYVELVRDGVEPKEAASRAKKASLDFRSLSNNEQRAARFIFTWWAFLRANANIHTRALFLNPERVLVPAYIGRTAWEGAGTGPVAQLQAATTGDEQDDQARWRPRPLTSIELQALETGDLSRLPFYLDRDVTDWKGRRDPKYAATVIASLPQGPMEFIGPLTAFGSFVAPEEMGDQRDFVSQLNPMIQAGIKFVDPSTSASSNRIPPVLMLVPGLAENLCVGRVPLAGEHPALADETAMLPDGRDAYWAAGEGCMDPDDKAIAQRNWQSVKTAISPWISRVNEWSTLGGVTAPPPYMTTGEYRARYPFGATRPVLAEEEVRRAAAEQTRRKLDAAAREAKLPPAEWEAGSSR